VATLVDGDQKAGPYSIAWDGATPAGRLPPGLYFVRLATIDRTVVQRLAILR
jgi:hypothetical protein